MPPAIRLPSGFAEATHALSLMPGIDIIDTPHYASRRQPADISADAAGADFHCHAADDTPPPPW
jgi:hypothetical protein